MHAGTVAPAFTGLYVAANVSAFRARRSSPKGGEGLLVVGPLQVDGSVQASDGRDDLLWPSAIDGLAEVPQVGDEACLLSGSSMSEQD